MTNRHWCCEDAACGELLDEVRATTLRQAADELARKGYRSAVTRLRDMASELDGGNA